MRKPKVKLENWSVVDSLLLQDYRDLVPGQRLTGRVRRLFGIPQGTVFTATIVKVDQRRQRVETPQAVYRLGKVSQSYEQWRGHHADEVPVGDFPVQAVAGVSMGAAQALR